MFKRLIAIAAMALASATVPSTAQAATTIDFEGLTGLPLSQFSTYDEDGFNVTRTDGTIRKNFLVGNPFKGLMATKGNSTFELKAIDGSPFTFISFDIAATFDGGTYSVFGDGSSTAFLTGGYDDFFFSTIASGATQNFSTLKFVFDTPGLVNTLRIDNIVLDVAAVPEPATWAMMMIGLGGIGFALRRRRNAQRPAAILAFAK